MADAAPYRTRSTSSVQDLVRSHHDGYSAGTAMGGAESLLFILRARRFELPEETVTRVMAQAFSEYWRSTRGSPPSEAITEDCGVSFPGDGHPGYSLGLAAGWREAIETVLNEREVATRHRTNALQSLQATTDVITFKVWMARALVATDLTDVFRDAWPKVTEADDLPGNPFKVAGRVGGLAVVILMTLDNHDVEVPDDAVARIAQCDDPAVLRKWLARAAEAVAVGDLFGG